LIVVDTVLTDVEADVVHAEIGHIMVDTAACDVAIDVTDMVAIAIVNTVPIAFLTWYPLMLFAVSINVVTVAIRY